MTARVLVVDDLPANVKLLEAQLSAEYYRRAGRPGVVTRQTAHRRGARHRLFQDDVLREFALRIRKSIRELDLDCPYGGEEFVVVTPETDLAVSTMVAERLRRRIASEPFAIQNGRRSLELTISVGIAGLTGTDTAASVLERADRALYRAKRDGRNRVVPDAA